MIKALFFLLLAIQIVNAKPRISIDTISTTPIFSVACTVWTSDTQLYATYFKQNDKYTGLYVTYFPNGIIKEKSKYKNGIIVDTSYEYYARGKIKNICVHNGPNITMTESGDTLAISQNCAGNPCGIAKSWYPNRQFESITHYNNLGQKHGLSETWREDGTRKDSTVYENDLFVESRGYFANGRLSIFMQFVNGKLSSMDTYTPDGKKLSTMRNGTGTFIQFSEDGNTSYTAVYKDGESITITENNPK